MFGYTLVKKSLVDSNIEQVKSLEHALEKAEDATECLSAELEQSIEKLNDEVKKSEQLRLQNEKLEEELKKLKDTITSEKNNNSVTLVIDDSLSKITPIIRHKSDVFEKLFQTNYLNDTQNNKAAIELALLTIATEGLSQLLEAFEEPFTEV